MSNWLESYKGRTNHISLNGTRSDEQAVNFGVPQGSVVGPPSFTFYTKSVMDIIQHHHLSFHIYADDTQLYTSFDPSIPGSSDPALKRLSSCIADIRNWMFSNKLKLNDQKTEFVVIASPRHTHQASNITLHIGTNIIEPSKAIIFDPVMSMTDHITSLCKSINFHLRNLAHIRKYIDQETCHHAVRTLIPSRLDYGNSILLGICRSFKIVQPV